MSDRSILQARYLVMSKRIKHTFSGYLWKSRTVSERLLWLSFFPGLDIPAWENTCLFDGSCKALVVGC